MGFGSAVREEDVLRLQVPVHDALRVQRPHGARQLHQEEPDGVFAQGALHWDDEKLLSATRHLRWLLTAQVIRQVAAVAILEKQFVRRVVSFQAISCHNCARITTHSSFLVRWGR